MNGALQLIEAERRRQIAEEGWTAEHDDEHAAGEMLRAASLYYAKATLGPNDPPLSMGRDGAPLGWPWDAKWWKPKDAERNLVRAGALCLAERDRLKRIPGAYRGHVYFKLKHIIATLADVRNAAPSSATGAGDA